MDILIQINFDNSNYRLVYSNRNLLKISNKHNKLGFRPNCSTVMAMQVLVNDIVEGYEKGQHTAVIFCDLSKVFRCIYHEIPSEKIHH